MVTLEISLLIVNLVANGKGSHYTDDMQHVHVAKLDPYLFNASATYVFCQKVDFG